MQPDIQKLQVFITAKENNEYTPSVNSMFMLG